VARQRAGGFLVIALAFSVIGGTSAQQVNPQAAALVDFTQRIQAYMDLRAKAVSGLDPLKPDADQATVAARERALGEAIRTARVGAKAGDLFSRDVAKIFRGLTKADFRRRSTHGKKLRLDELPHFHPVINQTYPSDWPLQTFPPSLLLELPKLPPELEYRFVDDALILRDTKANVVIDFLLDVM
jgi:hypothetical protein